MGVVKKGWNFVLDAIFPIECLGCKKEGEWICTACLARIPIEVQDFCFACKKVSLGGRTCFSCRRDFPLAGVIRFLDYDEPIVREGIHLAKYSFVRKILNVLCSQIFPYLSPKFDDIEIDPRAFLFVPIPLHKRRLRQRGFNQAEIIAKAIAEHVSAQNQTVLFRKRWTLKQADLQEVDRKVNIKNAFSCSERTKVEGQYICLIDDVATTGSTLSECARVLLNCGAKEVWGLVLAKG